ncbi:MAG: peptidoglycan DD-metalloendopeptidase family protein [Zoogloeaceae bacterium]|jgi:murein DD-endopeptidase MepM/ murein hydrolase activator NlpD|nr:peptidoglycan DD-metalloendopeptidase family protein [Zoogloeaceae bacterium]
MIKRGILNHPPEFFDRLWLQRWKLATIAGLSTLGMVTAIAVTPPPTLPPEAFSEVVEQLALTASAPLDQGDEIYLREARINRGDTLGRLLSRLGIVDEAAQRYLLLAPETQALHRQLVPGRVVSARTNAEGALISLNFPMNGGDTVTLVERQQGRLTAREQTLQYETQQVLKSGEIRYSLFGATDSAGIPDAIAVQMAEIFSGEIDFHRDLRQGDRFTLVYEMQYYAGRAARTGRILSAEFTNNGKTHQAFLYTQDDGRQSYYDAEGKSLKKAFLRSPLEFSRVTSGFALRFHPILKTWRAHKGVDYGAPTGTSVRATGDGVVQFVGKQGGYGNLVVLTHAGNYQTAYAHLSRFAAGLKKGDRVRQGDTIAYVGQTGWATGPHLHYEFRIKGAQVNPLSLNLPTAPPLDKRQQALFRDKAQEQLTLLQLLKDAPVAYFE